jgi:hypothetical protein
LIIGYEAAASPTSSTCRESKLREIGLKYVAARAPTIPELAD